MPRTIVTGGVGFIGYHVTRALLLRGEDVTVIDDFSSAPYPAFMKERNAKDLAAEFGERARVVRACVTDKDKLASAFDGVAGVIHLAGIAGVRPSFDDPTRYARVNVEGTGAIFELTYAAGISRLVVASSSSVYGNATPLPAREDAPAVAPESPYAASKRGAELLVGALSRKAKDISCTALRFFTVYGPRQRPEMAITLFVRKILADQPITIFGDGSMKRDFTHVEDITRGVLAAYDASEKSRGYRVYNLGSGAPITLAGLVDALGTATGKTPKVERAPVPLGDVDATFADIASARAELGWSPAMPLTQGLSSVVAWVRANPVGPS
jgi:UDP-glucuronate 4-epimerase